MNRFFRSAWTRRRAWLVAAVASLAGLGAGITSLRQASPPGCVSAGHACAVHTAPAAARDAVAPGLPAGPALVEFTSEGCPACRAMEPVLEAARSQCTATGASAMQLDVDSVAGGALASRLNVRATPTLVLFDGAHREATRLVGLHSVADVRKAIEESFGVACTKPARGATSGG
jgi:thiol:disulfide interchange protein